MAPTSKPKGGFDKSSLTGSFMGSIINEVCKEAGQGLQGFWVESLRATWLLRTLHPRVPLTHFLLHHGLHLCSGCTGRVSRAAYRGRIFHNYESLYQGVVLGLYQGFRSVGACMIRIGFAGNVIQTLKALTNES